MKIAGTSMVDVCPEQWAEGLASGLLQLPEPPRGDREPECQERHQQGDPAPLVCASQGPPSQSPVPRDHLTRQAAGTQGFCGIECCSLLIPNTGLAQDGPG